MNKKSLAFIAFIIVTIFTKAQSSFLTVDSLAGFDTKELQHHLVGFKGTEKQKTQYIATVKRRYINKKYGIGVTTNYRNGHTATQAYDCTNIGFEAGDISTWSVTGDYALTSGTNVDAFGNYPVVYPGGGNFSLQLSSNNVNTSNFQSSATRVITVTPANAFLNLHYAIDILDFPHNQASAAKFTVTFFDPSGVQITCPQLECYYYQNSAGVGTSIGMPNMQQTPDSPGFNLGYQYYPVNYQSWQTITADLSPYVGLNITCEIKCDWCIYNYDWAYCYIDADCSSSSSGSSITQSNPLCAGGNTILQGPPGMTTYSWTGPVTGAAQNLITNIPGNYTLTTTSTNSCVISIPALYYTLTQTTTASPTVSIAATNDSICVGNTATLTASGADTYTWSTSAITNSISVSPPTSATYTIIGTDTTTGCSGSAMQIIHVNTISIQATNNPVCIGTTATLTANGANTYTWSSNAGSATTNTVSVSPTSNTTYTITGKDTTNGCTSTSNQIVYVATNVGIQNPNPSICEGTTTSLTASGASSYTWSTGDTTANIIITPTITTSYMVIGTNACVNTGTTSVTVFPAPTLTVNSSSICEGITATLTVSGANTYTWNTGATTATIMVTPTVTTTYTVIGTGTNTCNNTTTAMVVVPVNPAPLICMVTTDSASNYGYNNIYWDKTEYNNVDSFIVYRYDIISTNYLCIGAVSKDSLSEFKDTVFSTGGPNGGNPLYSNWKYTLAIRDTCGNISAQSPYHQSMFVQESGANFSWNAYTIETGQVNPVTGYSFLRDDNNTGNWHVLINTAGLSSTDPNYASYPNGNWRVDALGFNCTPTYRLTGNNNTMSSYLKSHSNTIKPATTGIKELLGSNNQITIYPNPTNGNFSIETNATTKQTMQLFDVNGKMVLSQLINGKTTIDASILTEGVYNISIISNGGVVNKRLVIVR